MCTSMFSSLSSMFSGKSSTPTSPLPTPPSTAIADEMAQRQRAAAAKKKGRASTILTGNTDTGVTSATKKLLGE